MPAKKPSATDAAIPAIHLLPTGIAGFDFLGGGGIPLNRTLLVGGTSGAGKTVLATQFLAAGIEKYGEPGVLVTFEEKPDDILANVRSFGWKLDQWIKEGKLSIVDVSPQMEEDRVVVGEFELEALLARIRYAIKKIGAKRVVLDSMGSVFTHFPSSALIRRELLRVVTGLRSMKVTTIVTFERLEDYGPPSRFGVEEFVTDNVALLRNALEGGTRRRTVELLKFRGAFHHKGEFPFTIVQGGGVQVIPLNSVELDVKTTSERATSGNDAVDAMAGGGYFRDAIVLVSGATGTGKTLMTTEFLVGGAASGEKCLLLAFEESRDQLARNARSWGHDIEEYERQGKIKVVSEYPEALSLEDHLIAIRRVIEEFQPNRLALDSLSALERVGTGRGFREFIVGLNAYIKQRGITAFFTNTTTDIVGAQSVTDSHISAVTDTIVLLRYVEIYGDMRRGITILKMRGSKHDKGIREFRIDGNGMHVGLPFRGVAGILAGQPRQLELQEMERIQSMFADGE